MAKLNLFLLVVVVSFLGYFLFSNEKEHSLSTNTSSIESTPLNLKIKELESQITLQETENETLANSLKEMIQTTREAKEKNAELLSKNQEKQKNIAKATAQLTALREEKNALNRKNNPSPYQIKEELSEEEATAKRMRGYAKPEEIEKAKKGYIPETILQIKSLDLAQKETIKYWQKELKLQENKHFLKMTKRMIMEQSTSIEIKEDDPEQIEMNEFMEKYNQHTTEILTSEQKQELDHLLEEKINVLFLKIARQNK